MYIKKVKIKIITPMFSSGANKKKAEFRITELKALLRSTYREFFDYKDLDKSYKDLFGSTENKSPVSIRISNKNIQTEEKKNLLLHKTKPFKIPCIDKGKSIELIFQSSNENVLNLYMYILKLASITGGLGKRSRKGMGSFSIEQINDDIINLVLEDLLSKENNANYFKIELNKEINEYKLCKFEKKSNDKTDNDYIKYNTIHTNNKDDIPYVTELYKIKINPNQNNIVETILKKISNLTHERIVNSDTLIKKYDKNKLNMEILGNIKCGKLTRFASPVYTTLHIEKQGNKNTYYIIVKKLNYKYIYKSKIKQSILDEDYINGYINEVIEIAKEGV